MSDQLNSLAVIHWALKAGNNAYALDRMYEELHDPEIQSVVIELKEIQTHLNFLDSWFRDERILRLMPNELNDIETAIGSCTRSLAKLDTGVGEITSVRRGQPTQLIWEEIKARFKQEEGQLLLSQLNVHHVFLTKLFPILRLHFIFSKPQNRTEMERVHQQVRAVNGTINTSLYEQQLRQWEDYHRRVAEQAHRNGQPPSPDYSPAGFVPIRPNSVFPQSHGPASHHHGHNSARSLGHRYPGAMLASDMTFYHPYPSPPTSTSSNPSASPQQRAPSHRQRRGSMPPAPTAPPTPAVPSYPSFETPPRPSRPLSRHGSRESLRTPSPGPHHRLREAMRTPSPKPYGHLRERLPSPGRYGGLRETMRTPSPGPHGRLQRRFNRPGNEGSRCFGQHVEELIISKAESRIIEADCDNDLQVAIWRNENSRAARIVCIIDSVGSWVNDSSRHQVRFQSSCKLAFLTIKRIGRALYLSRRQKPWARLCFDLFEYMVYFFHGFLALRTWGPDSPGIENHEKWLAGEVPEFDALIDDHGNYNRLYILRDGETGKVRIASMLQESDTSDELIIWTAFLQDHFNTSNWMKRSSYMISFSQLSVSQFGEVIMLEKSYNNFTLTFLNTHDSTRFEEKIRELEYNYATNI